MMFVRALRTAAALHFLGGIDIKHGYEVMVGTRDSQKLSEWKTKAGKSGQIGTFTEAAAFGEIIVLAVKGTAARDTLKMAGAENLKGKTVILSVREGGEKRSGVAEL